MTKRRPSRGIALVLILLVFVLCAMMLGAFLQTNRNFLQINSRSRQVDQISDAVKSLYDVAKSSLEQDKTWGIPRSAKTKGTIGSLEFVAHEQRELADREGRFTGTFSNGLVFRMVVLNNMGSPAASPDGVPPRGCRITIAIYENPTSLEATGVLEQPQLFSYGGGAQVTLRNAALFDSSILASEAIELHSNKIEAYSKDPIRNQIRSNSFMKLPDVSKTSYKFGFLKETTPGTWVPNTTRGYQGTVWSKSDIVFGSDTTTSITKIEQAEMTTRANFVPHAQTQNLIPKLTSDDINVPSKVSTLQSGIYVFSKHWVSYGENDSLSAEIPLLCRMSSLPDGPDPGDQRDLSLDEFYYLKDSLPDAAHDNTKLRVGNVEGGAPLNGVKFRAQPSGNEGKFELPDSDGDLTGIEVDLATRSLEIQPGRTLHAPGEIIIQSASGDSITQSNLTSETEEPVTLNFGRSSDPDELEERSALVSEDNIIIKGYVKGKGSLIAEKTVHLLPNQIGLSTDTQTDLAVFAGEDVYIGQEVNKGSTEKVSFRGLVYADRNFHFQSDADLEVEGSIVARTGHVYMAAGQAIYDNEGKIADMLGFKGLMVIYNPEFLDNLLKPDVTARTKVELMSWRPEARN